MANRLFYIANIRLATEKAHGTQIMKMCEAFANSGYDTELVITNRSTEIKENPFSYYGVPNIFKIRRLWCLDTVCYGRSGFRLELLTFILSVVTRSLFQKGLFYTRDEFVALVLFCLGKKVVWEAHMGHNNLFVRTLLRLRVPLVVISRGLEDFYLKLGGSKELILVAPDAVDLEQFNIKETQEEARLKLNFELGKKIVMYAGSLYPWKGVDTLEKAVLLTDGVDLVLVSQKLPTEIPLYLKAADILVLPNSAKENISKHYTSPMKLFEYMASGVPIVASDLPSIREILDESKGYFFNPDDSESLKRVINVVFNEYSQALQKAEKARMAVEDYSWSKRVNKIITFIK